MEYRVIRHMLRYPDYDDDTIENDVNRLLTEGWQVSGGLSVTTLLNGHVIMCQAMVRVRPLLGNNRTTLVNIDVNSTNPSNNINRMRG